MKFCPECERDYSEDTVVCPEDGTRLVFVTQSEDDLLGKTVDGRYTLEQKIGEGGMGAVYLATQEAVGRKVALKILRRDLAEDAGAVKRFFHEAKVVSRLRHPNTITLYDFGQSEEGLLYIAMEYMTGERLDALLESRVPRLPEIVDIIDQVCQSLAEAHDAGIVHRDLKPENIFIDIVGRRNLVKVLDFGIAKVQGQHTNLTLTGMVFGTPAYMSPEQAQGFELDHRTDLYSLGVVLYELLCGRLPYEGDSAMRMAMSHILSPIPDVSANARYQPLPPKLGDLVRSLMAKRPDERPESADAVRKQLLEVARDLETYPSSALRAVAVPEGLASALASTSGPLSGQRVAVRERPTPAPLTTGETDAEIELPVPEDTGPNRHSAVFTTAELVERSALEHPTPTAAQQRRSSWTWAAAGAAVALLCASAALYVAGMPPFERREAGPESAATAGAAVAAVPGTPEREVATPAPVEPAAEPEPAGEVTAAVPEPAAVDVAAAPAEAVQAPLELARHAHWALAETAAIWGGVGPNVMRPLALATAPAFGSSAPAAVDGALPPAQVHIALDLRPADAEVRRAETQELLCVGPDCLDLRLPRGSETVGLVVSRRRYESEQLQIVPDQDASRVVALDRARAAEPLNAAGHEQGAGESAPVPSDSAVTAPEAEPGVGQMADTSAAAEPEQTPADDPPVLNPPANNGSPLMAPVIIRAPDTGP